MGGALAAYRGQLDWRTTLVIDGMRNPNLWALTGETVRITIVNGETMVQDVAMEKADVRSAQILDRGASASITFKANVSDTYYCALPGHRAAGMKGRFDASDQPRVPPEGVAPAANGRPLNLDFETGTLENCTGSAALPVAARARGRSRRRRSA